MIDDYIFLSRDSNRAPKVALQLSYKNQT